MRHYARATKCGKEAFRDKTGRIKHKTSRSMSTKRAFPHMDPCRLNSGAGIQVIPKI